MFNVSKVPFLLFIEYFYHFHLSAGQMPRKKPPNNREVFREKLVFILELGERNII